MRLFPLLAIALLAAAPLSPTARAQSTTARTQSTATLTVDRVSSPVLAGVVTDPSGRELNLRNLHAGDVAPAETFTKTVTKALPAKAMPGMYRVELPARAGDRTVLASAPTSFVVLGTSMPEPAPGMALIVSQITSSVQAGNSVSLDFDFQNNSPRTVDQIFAVVTDPSGRTLTARHLYSGDLAPGETLQKTVTRPIPEKALAGTYQVQIQARSKEGDILASQPTSFTVTN